MSDRSLIKNDGATDESFPTNTDLSGKQYHFVKLDSNEEIVACGANDAPTGILQNAPDGSSNEDTAEVRINGGSKLKVSESVESNDRLTPTSDAKGEIADAAGEEYGARALTSGDSDDLISAEVVVGKIHSSDA